MAVVNSSGWPPTSPINASTKAQLLQGLIVEEVVHRRWSQLLAFRKGLKSLGVLQLVQIFPGQFKEIFVYIDRSITYNTLSDMISSKCPPERSVDVTVYKWFNQYMKDREGMTYWLTTWLPRVLGRRLGTCEGCAWSARGGLVPPSLLRGGTREANKPRMHPPRSTDHAEPYQEKGSAEEKKKQKTYIQGVRLASLAYSLIVNCLIVSTG